MVKKILGFTPARGGSVTVPRKNMKLLDGEPLLGHTIRQVNDSETLDMYVVNSEDPEIRRYAASKGVVVQGRPREFWHDNSVQEVDRLISWSIRDLEKTHGRIDVVALLYATSPLRLSSHIDATIRLVSEEGFDSALTLCEDRSYLWRIKDESDSSVLPTNYEPAKRGPNQMEGWNQWRENKAVYAFSRDLILDTGCRLGGRIGFVEMDSSESVDIDTPADFQIAEAIMTVRR